MSVHNFPEVYHGQGISKAVFSAPARRGTGKVDNTISARFLADDDATSCVSVLQRAGEDEEDPGLPFFGSDRKKRELYIGVTYPYA
ncbi:hypothetical protein F9H41_22655 [Salmonella enterica subsp. enterica serovar Montevideo]|uniref:Uncharacterized protein n=3 Tax=Salmonella enterica TaxID=28901 RepID=A0A629S1B2_SALMO|nr:hypothetical protein [Salmonella enterica]ECB6474622.1 hypothetical protein [Salmonella enterica subsp. enterica serovar Alachua]ECD4223042.1 hypothetical protein [Salmonella enterica subsp. enterica serovar Bredeney]ECD4888380.1 hypothetical protein [Salmonella enterica subsp. enterica serovar London]ECF0872436.1 hypothetical protein [Salmonella enterica subsp. enterica serovar Newport]ECM6271068.1 hypothetical protein [Salmonella enterica subsp. enterica serovar Montevideo]EDC6187905.1 h